MPTIHPQRARCPAPNVVFVVGGPGAGKGTMCYTGIAFDSKPLTERVEMLLGLRPFPKRE